MFEKDIPRPISCRNRLISEIQDENIRVWYAAIFGSSDRGVKCLQLRQDELCFCYFQVVGEFTSCVPGIRSCEAASYPDYA